MIKAKGLTLVELLVALTVITILGSIALPSVKTILEGQRISRASNLVQSIIEEARARAIFEGGGVGVVFYRRGNNSVIGKSECTQMQLARVSRRYSGEAGASVAFVGIDGSSNTRTGQYDADVISLWFSPFATEMVRTAADYQNDSLDRNVETLYRPGDDIRVQGVDRQFSIDRITYGDTASGATVNSNNNYFLGDFGAGPYPRALIAAGLTNATQDSWVRVVIKRADEILDAPELRRRRGQPIEFEVTGKIIPTVTPPVVLPRGVAVDLTSSGIGRFGDEFSPYSIVGNYGNYTSDISPQTTEPFVGTLDFLPVVVMFGARGQIDSVQYAVNVGTGAVPVLSLVRQPVLGDVFLLVGESGAVAVEPGGQLEDDEVDPLSDQQGDGKVPLLNTKSVWIGIRARSGRIFTSPWVDPTPDDDLSDLTTFLNYTEADNARNGTTVPAVQSDAGQAGEIALVINKTRTAAIFGEEE